MISLTESDLRARYGRGPWRVAKWLADPFALVGVYALLMTFVIDRGGRAPGLSLACAVIPFQLVMASVVNSMSVVYLRAPIILNMSFRRILLPVSATLTETLAFAASLVLVPLMMVVHGVPPTASLGWFPLVVVTNVLFALGCAYPASLFGLWAPEVRPLAVSFVRAMFFLSPALVPLAEIGGRANELVRLNPLTGLFEAYRATLLFGEPPAPWQLLYPLAVAIALLVVSLPVYIREQRHFAKVVW